MPIRILFAEDLKSDVELAQLEIKRGGIVFVSQVVDTEQEFRKALVEFKPDIIVSDYSMPEFDGMSALEITRAFELYLPFIMLTGSMNEETAVACMKAGANDYVLKENITRLPFAVKESIESVRARREKILLVKQLEESESKFRVLAESVGAILWEYDIQTDRWTYVAPQSEDMLGYTPQEWSNLQFWADRIHPDDRQWATDYCARCTERGKDHVFEYRFIKDNGGIVWLRDHVHVEVVDGKPDTLRGFLTDITDRKNDEVKLIQAKEKAEESDRLKSAFLANVSHEIRTPMNGILGFLDLIREPELDDSQREKYIDVVTKSGQRLLGTINDIVEISKIESGQVEVTHSTVNITDVMNFHYEFFSHQADKKGLGLHLNSQIIGKGDVVKTDRYKLEGILTNLLNNALKFTDTGSIEFGNQIDHDALVFYVKDSGIGIPSNRLDAVFERFVHADLKINRPHEGSGLGLSIAKAYVEALNGRMWVESEEGKGSSFFFSIPYVPVSKEIKKSVARDAQQEHFSNDMTILVAEDDEMSFEYLQVIFEREAIHLTRTINGEDTVNMVQEHPDISLVLMDIKMPGMNGLEATRQIRRFNKSIPIIAQTAYALTGDREMAIEAGCNDYITKPIRRDEFIDLIQKYLSIGMKGK